MDVPFYLLIITFVISDVFAESTDWQHTAKLLNIINCVFELTVGQLQIGFYQGQFSIQLQQILILLTQLFFRQDALCDFQLKLLVKLFPG